LGRGESRSAPRCHLLEILAPLRRDGVGNAVGRSVVVELALPVAGDNPKHTDVPVGHDGSRGGAGKGIAMATACGNASSR